MKWLAGWSITVVAAVVIGWLTLRPGAVGAPPPSSGVTLLTDVVLNVVLFGPLGIGLGLVGYHRRLVVAIGTLASIGIECVQFLMLPSRDATLHDVIANGIGTLLGVLAVEAWGSRAEGWRRTGPATSFGLAAVWVLGAALVRPAIPSGAIWYGFWAHQIGNAVQFPGRILGFSLNGGPIPDGLIQPQAKFQHSLARSDTLIAITRLVLPPPFAGRAQLAAIMSPTGEELLSLWQEGGTLLARVRLRVTDARLREPWFALEGGMRGRPGDTLTITLAAYTDRVGLSIRGSGAKAEQEIPLSPQLFWASFIPWDYAVGGGPVSWLLLATALAFGGIGLGSARHRLAGTAVAVAALLLPAGLFGSAPLPWPILGLALVTVLAGQRLGRHLGFGPARRG